MSENNIGPVSDNNAGVRNIKAGTVRIYACIIPHIQHAHNTVVNAARGNKIHITVHRWDTGHKKRTVHFYVKYLPYSLRLRTSDFARHIRDTCLIVLGPVSKKVVTVLEGNQAVTISDFFKIPDKTVKRYCVPHGLDIIKQGKAVNSAQVNNELFRLSITAGQRRCLIGNVEKLTREKRDPVARVGDC